MATHLFLASTPFNVLTAAMVAFELPEGDRAILGLIDQTDTTQAFRDTLDAWHEMPFEQLRLMSRKVSGKQKRAARKVAFVHIKQCLDEFKPDWIYTGNDRRIEFQYAIAHCSTAKGAYIDDGTYSYLGRSTHWLKDQVIDNLLKKLVYGFWWKQPTQIGASDWIDKAIVAFPELVIPEIRRRGCKLLPNNLERTEFSALTTLALKGYVDQLQNIQTLVLLPHHSAVSDSQENLAELIKPSQQPVFYKHHPRTEESFKTLEQMEMFWKLPPGSKELPASTPIELLLPLLPNGIRVIGGLSTALLTCKWLRPDLDVQSTDKEPQSAPWLNLLLALGVRTASQTQQEGVLTLKAEHFIAAGRDRSCYRHPDMPNELCIKVSPRDNTQSKREVRFYQSLIRRNIPWDFISRYKGTVKTNLGTGEIFDYVTDEDGNPSKPIRHYMYSGKIDVDTMQIILAPLIETLLKHNILMKDMSDANIVIKKSNSTLTPVIIDGLGDTVINIRSYLPYFGRKKIRKSYHKMRKKMIREFGQ